MLVRVLAAWVFLVFFLACAGVDPANFTPIPPPTADWVGTWEGTDAHLVITPEGMAAIETRGASSSRITAPIQEFGDGFLRVGLGPFSQNWTVTPPWEGPTGWTLILDGHVLTRTSTAGVIDEDPQQGLPRIRVDHEVGR
jgi:hypothetical protein